MNSVPLKEFFICLSSSSVCLLGLVCGLCERSAKENGYRVYDENSARRMAQILYYRELGFSLKSIGTLMDCQENDRICALKEQKRLLELKRKRLDRLIDELDRVHKGEIMSFKVFDNSEFIAARDNYAEEVKRRWGKTEEYHQYIEKSSEISPQKQEQIDEQMNALSRISTRRAQARLIS